METIPITIVGGGVIGCAIAYELSKYKDGIFLFEKNAAIGEEQSGRNSGVIHDGIYYNNAPLKRKFCIEGNKLLYEFCKQHNITFAQTGKLIVATNETEELKLNEYLRNASEWNIPVKKVSKEDIKVIEPNVYAKAGILSPTSGIIDSATFVQTLAKLAKEQKVEIITQAKIVDVKPNYDEFLLTVCYTNGASETFKTKLLINAAGLYSDEIAKLVNIKNNYEIIPIRGEYCRFNSQLRKEINICSVNIYPVEETYCIDGKEYRVLGVHLTQTFELSNNGNKVLGRYILVGPTAKYVKNKSDYETGRYHPEYFVEKVKKFFPALNVSDLELDYAGIRAKLKNEEDFVIKQDEVYPNAIHLLGIDSPGLTSSLAIAKYVSTIIHKINNL
ncbi:MAG: NAD(P)/FAD-dependent oxidoreductase [Endomicrobia bacterium]|nr:NAD(P)/FAD-dependent oxidoreductase [Endomicrobiia bacterium]